MLHSINKENIKKTKLIFVGFCFLKVFKLIKFEWCFDKVQPKFGENILEFLCIFTNSYIFSFKQIKGLIEASKYFKEDFDLSVLDPAHELYSKDNEQSIGKLKLKETAELDLDGAIFSRSKFYFINLKQNSSCCKHKRVQDHKKFTLEEYNNCLEIKQVKYGVNSSLSVINIGFC